jgi:Flp pilus assembly protein TadG
MLRIRVSNNDRGAATVEMAFALPVLVVMLYAFVQLAEVYRAVAGMQQALGEGARFATLCYTQSATGCAAPTSDQIKAKINSSVYGIGPGTFDPPTVTFGSSGTANYYDLSVTYSQPTTLLMFPGPTMSLTRKKRVWIATST